MPMMERRDRVFAFVGPSSQRTSQEQTTRTGLELAQIDHGRKMANFRFVHAEQIAKVLKVLDGDEGD